VNDSTPYLYLGYAVALALLWGYALSLWLAAHALRGRAKS
jgi:hypothetical protein